MTVDLVAYKPSLTWAMLVYWGRAANHSSCREGDTCLGTVRTGSQHGT